MVTDTITGIISGVVAGTFTDIVTSIISGRMVAGWHCPLDVYSERGSQHLDLLWLESQTRSGLVSWLEFLFSVNQWALEFRCSGFLAWSHFQ